MCGGGVGSHATQGRRWRSYRGPSTPHPRDALGQAAMTPSQTAGAPEGSTRRAAAGGGARDAHSEARTAAAAPCSRAANGLIVVAAAPASPDRARPRVCQGVQAELDAALDCVALSFEQRTSLANCALPHCLVNSASIRRALCLTEPLAVHRRPSAPLIGIAR